MAAYVTVADANKYFSARLFAENWFEADNGNKIKALDMATKQIDRLPLKGRPADPNQELQFPRAYIGGTVLDRQQYFDFIQGWWYEQEVPERVKNACCEQALFLLTLTKYERDRNRQHILGIVTENLDLATEISDKNLVSQMRKRTILCPEAREYLLPYLVGKVRTR